MPEPTEPSASAETPAPRELPPAAVRALKEAEERRAALTAREAELAANPEVNGRGGKDPVRYTDWEIKGIAADF